MRQRLKGRNSVSACDVDAAQQVSQQASKQPSSDTEKVSPAPVQDGPLVSFDAGQQNVLDNQLGVKVQEEPAAVSDRAPHSDVQDAETKTFCGRSLDEVMVLEIFAGSARLTRAIRDIGMAAMAVDKDSTRAQSVHVACYDLNDPDQLQALCDFISKHHHQILWAHFAPSCGTASRARGRPLPKLAKMGIKVPQPLRSDEQPLGLDGLAGTDKIKAETANITYDSTCLLVRLCHSYAIAVSLENPENSLFWKIPVVILLLEELGGHMTYFDNCCHGGTRKKGTAWWSTVDWFTCLAARCDGSHFHEKWNAELVDGKVLFPTHLEAAYPVLLCARLAAIAKIKAIDMGAVEIQNLEQQTQHAPSSQHRFLLGMLPRGRKFKPLVSEFGQYEKWAVPRPNGPSDEVFLKSFPKGTKIIHRLFHQGVFRVDDGCDTKQHDACCGEHSAHEILTIGVPREAVDFLSRAVQVGHPRAISIHLSDSVKDVLRKNFSGSDYLLAKERASCLWKWSKRAKELNSEEMKFHKGLAPHLQHLLKGKRLLLLKEVLEDLGYPDHSLVDEIASGFTLHGWMTESNVFPKETKRPEYTVDMVRNMAKGLNQMIFGQVNGTSDDELARTTWESTLDEIEKQWVWRDVTSDMDDVILAKRFGLQQKNKVRVIDDCTIGGYNKAFGTKEKLRVHAIDQLAAYLSWLCTDLGDDIDDDIVGRTYDLRSAYKQFGVSVETRDLLRLLVWDSDQHKPCLLGINALPFGASGSVSAFLRISMALWYVGTVGLKLCWTVFYDDFTVICKRRLSHGTSIAAEALFDLFGMWYAKEGSKAVEFGGQVKTLGLLVELGNVRKGFTIGHTQERREELRAALTEVLETKKLEPKQAERLRGRMQWFEGYAFGRVAQHSLRTLGEIALKKQKVVELAPHELAAIDFLARRVSEAETLKLSPVSLDTLLVFTDGACEGESDRFGSIGGVIVDKAGRCHQHFSYEVPTDFMRVALSESSNPIYELELLPIYVAICVWGHLMQSAHVVFYLDNDAARAALCKGCGGTRLGQSIVQHVMEGESKLKLKSWYARVPSHSNISDGPSRMDCTEVLQLGSTEVKADWDFILESLL